MEYNKKNDSRIQMFEIARLDQGASFLIQSLSCHDAATYRVYDSSLHSHQNSGLE
jgi:hypothetical protein